VIGCDDTDQLEENVSFAASFRPMTDKEEKEIIKLVSPFAKRLMYYKP
jgi:predicted aldo/keto reductase-like oxidoreductase